MKRYLLFLVIWGACFAQTNWPLLNNDACNSNWARDEKVLSPPLKLANEFGIASDALSYYGGIIYSGVANTPNEVHAYSIATGQELWEFMVPNSGGSVGFCPAVSDSIVLVTGQGCDTLYALNRFNGALKWKKMMGRLYGRNACISGDQVFILSSQLYCLELKTGAEIWTFPLSGQASPIVDADYVFVLGRVINRKTRQEERSFPVLRDNSIALDEDNFYYGTGDSIIAVDKKTWSNKWRAKIPYGEWPEFHGSAMAITDQTLTFVMWKNLSNWAEIYTLNKENGVEMWHYTINHEGISKPTVANGIVYVTTLGDYALWAFDLQSGEVKYRNIYKIFNESSIVADGRLIIAGDWHVCVFEKENTFVSEPAGEQTMKHQLYQNYPNPFNHSTTIPFYLPRSETTSLAIYNASGQLVKKLTEQVQPAGLHQFVWDGTNLQNKLVPSGVYFYRLKIGDQVLIKKMILLL